VKVARIYMRVSTEEQDLNRQNAIVESTKATGFYVAGIYREKASGARDEHEDRRECCCIRARSAANHPFPLQPAGRDGPVAALLLAVKHPAGL